MQQQRRSNVAVQSGDGAAGTIRTAQEPAAFGREHERHLITANQWALSDALRRDRADYGSERSLRTYVAIAGAKRTS
jgi:hypothetical protein